MWRSWIFCALLGMQNGTAAMENSMVVYKKLNIELPYDPAVPLLGINPKSFKAGFFFLTILLNIIDS